MVIYARRTNEVVVIHQTFISTRPQERTSRCGGSIVYFSASSASWTLYPLPPKYAKTSDRRAEDDLRDVELTCCRYWYYIAKDLYWTCLERTDGHLRLARSLHSNQGLLASRQLLAIKVRSRDSQCPPSTPWEARCVAIHVAAHLGTWCSSPAIHDAYPFGSLGRHAAIYRSIISSLHFSKQPHRSCSRNSRPQCLIHRQPA
ncbi:uncharacterized protein C8Q71DRAFT_277780 [Rhodofomes roseus]|uniref:Uncharacterized protein n=1 Tax=Rhodofomes roseus TaxID=34475 RepID=A0ABQ8K4X8_9APHY|nr:uncharacterized protein C8Q71DRAFT_277780 [Rhodofomes roseus]KAH9832016.1 hypothetical protein C8Q71DRAFT_277780 [Rhodofomes roseus]